MINGNGEGKTAEIITASKEKGNEADTDDRGIRKNWSKRLTKTWTLGKLYRVL